MTCYSPALVADPTKPRSYPILGYLATKPIIFPVARNTTDLTYSRLRSLLRRIRLEAGLTQGQLARVLGQPQSFVSKYESGERRLDFVEVRQVCEAAGVSLEDFVGRFEAEAREAR